MSQVNRWLTAGLLALCMWVGAAHGDDEPALLSVTAVGKNMDETTRDLIQAIGAHNYQFVRTQAIDSRLVPEAWESGEARIVYFCNFAQMNRALALDPRSAEFLPCRVTLLQKRSGIEMVAINPAWVSGRLNNAELHDDCLKLKQDYLDIMNEAAL